MVIAKRQYNATNKNARCFLRSPYGEFCARKKVVKWLSKIAYHPPVQGLFRQLNETCSSGSDKRLFSLFKEVIKWLSRNGNITPQIRTQGVFLDHLTANFVREENCSNGYQKSPITPLFKGCSGSVQAPVQALIRSGYSSTPDFPVHPYSGG
ncbi:hypothetical protein NA78x_002969 [Anatilimnocola sp. NA78]|uniref:hypothetical protein n=1 Tax=Anatilimnocola sp. NA78 TaxID=3415683 RepID=UPI003CE59BA2